MTGTAQQGSVLGGRYALIEHLASGGMGDVWRASDGVLDRVVAVKVLKPELFEDPAFRERFRREARHAGSLSHPGIAAVFDYGEEARSAYLVMELIPGEPLSIVLARRGPLPAEAVTSLLRQAAAALGAAHHAGIVHRDVKPGNLLVQPNGQVKITDFGIARALGASTLTLHGQVLGTAAYLSPEQAAGRTATAASDVYSLGVVAYEALTGRPPFEGEAVSVALAHTQQAPPPLPATVPPALRGVIARAMAKRPADRPADGDALAAMLPPVSGGDDRTPLQAAVPTSIAPVALDRTQPAVFGPTEPAVFGPTEPAVFGPTEPAVFGPTEPAVPIVTTAEAPRPAQVARPRPAGRAGRTRRRGHRFHRVDVGGRSLTVVRPGHRHHGGAERDIHARNHDHRGTDDHQCADDGGRHVRGRPPRLPRAQGRQGGQGS